MRNIHVFGGGTFSHVRSHLAIAAPAFGETAKKITNILIGDDGSDGPVFLTLTKMADSKSVLATNDDVASAIDKVVADPNTKMIFLNVAFCDYDGTVVEDHGEPIESGKYSKRLKTSEGDRTMVLSPADKVISRIRKHRKDIFLVAFKTTSGENSKDQYLAGLNLLKANSANLVLANDVVTRNNMVITPEEARYYETTDRDTALNGLVKMALERSQNTFTRSTVVDGEAVAWSSPLVPDNLRTVVDHCIERGAYKPFRKATVGHFATRVDKNRILTSRRKSDFNNLPSIGLVDVTYKGLDEVVAVGGKPSVGGQSQRIIFDMFPDLDCIVHAHVPLRPDAPDIVPVATQEPYECGSHQCGQNTATHLKSFDNGIYAVMLDNHGPNIVFSRDTSSAHVIEFIERNFDLSEKTGGLVA